MRKIKELEKYAPDFPREIFSERDKFLLSPFVSSVDSPIFVFRNLPPEIVGALCSRASRASGSLLGVFLREYLYPLVVEKELSEELEKIIVFLEKGGFKKILDNQRAQSFYAKWLAQFGDDSIAQLTGVHVVFEGISQIAIKFIEEQRIGLEPIEKSTRYVQFGEKVNGRYPYYIPYPDLEKMKLLKEYKETLDNLFAVYSSLQKPLIIWLKKNFNEKDSVLEKKAFDVLRGLLPLATLGQLSLRGNAQAFEYLINRGAFHPLGELRWLVAKLKEELDKEIPSLLLRLERLEVLDYQKYLSQRAKQVLKFIRKKFLQEVELNNSEKFLSSTSNFPRVRLLDYDSDGEAKIIAALIFPHLQIGWDECLNLVSRLSLEEKKKLLGQYFCGRKKRWQKVGRAFENCYLRFEIVTNIGAYRDLQRHRMLTQERQRFSVFYGYDVPTEIIEAKLEGPFREALERAAELFLKIEAFNPDLAQYVVPLAYRVRFYQFENIREFFWEVELRTDAQGHPDYRFIEQEKYRLFKEKFPLIAQFMLVDLNDYRFARRNSEKIVEEKEKKILEVLKKKRQN